MPCGNWIRCPLRIRKIVLVIFRLRRFDKKSFIDEISKSCILIYFTVDEKGINAFDFIGTRFVFIPTLFDLSVDLHELSDHS